MLEWDTGQKHSGCAQVPHETAVPHPYTERSHEMAAPHPYAERSTGKPKSPRGQARQEVRG